MKLTYRGVSYEPNSPHPEMIESEVVGQYRGNSWKQRYPRHIPVPQPAIDLKYRGVSYSSGHPLDVEACLLRRQYAATVSQPALAKNQVKSIVVSDRQQQLTQLNQTHTTNIRQRLQHRLQVAKANGDQKLIEMLEAEAKQLI